MSVLVVGMSHKTAPVSVLERLALDTDGVAKLVRDVLDNEHVGEATVIATCNRIEVYADVDRFHGSVEGVSGLMAERAGELPEALVGNLYVHYDDGALSHLFHVAAGLDSMAVGESQILGQVREALRVGQEAGAVGPVLNSLFQQALRVGKRAHAETAIDQAAPSLVDTALDRAATDIDGLAGRTAVVVGAGSMAGLAAAKLSRLGIGAITVVNRTPARARRLATQYDGRSAGLDELPDVLAGADLLFSCTGSPSVLLDADTLAETRDGDAPLVVVDLALPHDVDPAAARIPGVSLITLATLADEVEQATGDEVGQVREIVAEELAAFLAARRASHVTPTVVALRTMATGVVDGEAERLLHRLPDLDGEARDEVVTAMRRIADKLLHQPTVRVRELANEAGAVSYAAALAELFALDPEAVQAVTSTEVQK